MPLEGPPLAEPVSLVRTLARGLAEVPDAPALVSLDRAWSFRELAGASDALAANYLDLGLKPGDRVASLLPNSPESVLHYLACLKAGLVATPLNYRYAVPEIDHSLQTAAASVLIAAAERRAEVGRSAPATRLPLGVIWHGEAPAGARRLNELFAHAAPRALPPPALDAPAFIFFTSGSTGLPKGVTHTHRTFGWTVASCVAAFELEPGEVSLPGTSLSHIAGIILSLSALTTAGRVAVPRRSDGDEVLPLLRAQRPALIMMLPAPLLSLIRDHAARPADFASVRICICGGDKVSEELEREYVRLTGRQIDEVYGMTETGTITCSPIAGPVREGSVGRPCPGYACALRADDGREVERGEEGRLWVQSPSTMVGYWNAPTATAEVLRDGWMDTGDVMRADADGYLWFRARKKQLIIHDGSNIAPQEVEEALLAHPAVASAGAIGVHDALHGENVRAYVALRDDAAPPTAGELQEFARARIAAYKVPETIVFLDAIPLTPVGKVDRVALKRLAEDALHGR